MNNLVVIAGPHGARKKESMLNVLGQSIVRGKYVDPRHIFETLKEYYAVESYKGEKTPDFVKRAFERAFTIWFERIKNHKNVTAVCTLGTIEDLDLLDAAKRNNYYISLYFFGVDNWRTCERNLREDNNHWLSKIKSEVIFGDYHRALAMLPGAIVKCDDGIIFDNTNFKKPKPLLGIENGRVKVIEKNLPHWILEPLSRCL